MPLEVDDIIAHAVYDPVARRERYLRSRKLKGRQPAQVKTGVGSRIIDANTPIGSARHYPSHVNVTQARQAASDARQIATITKRLDALKSHLKELLAKKKAEESSSSKTSSTSKTESKSTSTTKSEPKTAKQKQAAKDAIKKAQAARAQQQKATPNATNKPELTLDQQITQCRAAIADVTRKLQIVKARVQSQTASNGR